MSSRGGSSSSGVADLVKSIKQHKKFRQLASYSVQCLAKVITPPHQGWEANAREAFDAGALEAITEVLTRHSGDSAVLQASTKCLTSMASNPKYAGTLVECGAMRGMLESVAKNPEGREGVMETLALLDTVATHNPQALLDGGLIDVLGSLMGSTERSRIVASCARAIEKINRLAGGSKALVDSGVLEPLLATITRRDNSSDPDNPTAGAGAGASDDDDEESTVEIDPNYLEPCFRTLDRMCRVKELADEVRSRKGLEMMSKAMALHKTNDKVGLTGSRLLTKLASGNVKDLVERLHCSTDADEKEFLAQLSANLALEEDNADKILEAGGVSALVDALSSSDSSTVENAARGLARLAHTEASIDTMVESGAVKALVAAVNSAPTNLALAASITPTLLRFATEAKHVDTIVSDDGLTFILKGLQEHPEDLENSRAAIKFIENLGVIEYDLEVVRSSGGVPAVVSAMRAHPTDTVVQLFGTRVLIYMMDSEAHALACLSDGALEANLSTLSRSEQLEKTVLKAAIYLSTSFALLPQARSALDGLDGVTTILGAISGVAKDTDAMMRSYAMECVAAVVSEESVSGVVRALDASLKNLLRTKSDEAAKDLISKIRIAGAASIVTDNAEVMVRTSGVKTLVSSLEKIATTKGIPMQEDLLKATCSSLFDISDAVADNDELRELLGKSGAVQASISAVKAHPKLEESVMAAVSFLSSYAKIEECAKDIMENGGIEACVCAIRANISNGFVVMEATNTLLRLAESDEGAIAVAHKGGTRQIISAVEANTGNPGFKTPLGRMLALLQRVAFTAEGSEVLVRQGGVDAVIGAADAIGDVSPAVTRVLSKLLTRDDVTAGADTLKELGDAAGAGALDADAAKAAAVRAGHMALVGNYSDVLSSMGGAGALANMLSAALASEDPVVQADLAPALIQAAANFALKTPLDLSLGFVECAAAAATAGLTTTEPLSLIRNIALLNDSAAASLAAMPAALDCVSGILSKNLVNDEVVQACFETISAMAATPESAQLVATSPAADGLNAWVDDNMYDAAPETMQAALAALAALSNSADFAKGLMSTGCLELVKAVLTAYAAEEEPTPALLGSATTLLSRIVAADPGALDALSEAGILRRVLKAVGASPKSLEDAGCVTGVFELIALAAGSDTVRVELASLGVEDLLIAGMNAHSTNEDAMKAGAHAMAALGLGAEAGKSALFNVQTLAGTIETSSMITEDMVLDLGLAVQRLSNLVQVDGVVSGENSEDMLSSLSNAMMLLAESELASPEMLAAGISAIGVLGGAEEVLVPIEDAMETVMDVLALNPGVPSVQAATMHCIGLMALKSSNIAELSKCGAIDAVLEAAKSASASEELMVTVNKALSTISASTNSDPGAIIASDGGVEALETVITANEGDQAALAECVESIVATSGGSDALWQVLSESDGSGVAVMAEMMRVLKSDTVTTASVAQAQGLVRAVQASLSSAKDITGDHRANIAGSQLTLDTITMMGATEISEEAAVAIVSSGGVDSLMQLLKANKEDPDACANIVKFLRRVADHPVTGVSTTLASKANMSTISSVMRTCMDLEDVVGDCVELMGAVALSAEVVEDGIDRDGMRLIVEASETYATNAVVSSKASSIVTKLQVRYNDEPARLLDEKMAQTATVLANAGQYLAQKMEDGSVYYYNAETQETSWDKPEGYAALEENLAQMADLAAKQQSDNIVTMSDEQLTSVVSVMETHAASSDLSQAAANTLQVLAANPENCDTIARVGGIRAIMAAIRVNPDNVDLLRVLLILLERISRNDFFKEEISREGGVAIVVEIGLQRHLSIEEICSKCLSTLANLAYNSEANIHRIIEFGGVKCCEAAMQAYPTNARLLENAMCTLSNLMYGSDENKLMIGQTCGDEIVGIIRVHHTDKNLFKMALRALGNLSYCDENIRFIVDEKATAAIVQGMRSGSDDEEALQLAMEVIGNFASLEEEEDSTTEPVPATIYREEGCAVIIDTMKRLSHNSAILKSGLDALSNIANDVETTELMASHLGVVQLLISIMQSHDWDEQLIEHAVPLLSALTYGEACTEKILSLDGVQVLLTLMDTHSSNTELISHCQMALSNIAVSQEARTLILNIDGAATVLRQLETQIDKKAFVQECLSTLTRLCGDDALSAQIAEQGMHRLMRVIHRYESDPEFLTHAFRLLGHLAFVEANLKTIVQHNGVQAVISAICAHPESKALMVRSIQTIDNVAMANAENAAIVIDEGGRQLIEEIMTAYSDDEEIQRYGKSAILSMSALENLSKSAEIAASATKDAKRVVVEEDTTDPLADFRHMLSAGQVLQVWTKGSPKTCHVLVSPDWRSVVWQDPKKGKKLGAMDLRSVVMVRAGVGVGHKPKLLSRSKVNPDCALSLVGEHVSLDLETTVRPDAAKWVDGLTKLLHVFKTKPHLL